MLGERRLTCELSSSTQPHLYCIHSISRCLTIQYLKIPSLNPRQKRFQASSLRFTATIQLEKVSRDGGRSVISVLPDFSFFFISAGQVHRRLMTPTSPLDRTPNARGGEPSKRTYTRIGGPAASILMIRSEEHERERETSKE